MNTAEKIQAVKNTLALVSVAGPENWDRMLGCWQTLTQVEKELKEDESGKTTLQERDSEDTAAAV